MRVLLVAEGAAGSAIAELLRMTSVTVDLAASIDAAQSWLRSAGAPEVVVLDSACSLERGACKGLLLAGADFPLVLMAEAGESHWEQWVLDGVVDDLIPRTIGSAHLRLRLERVCRAHKQPQPLRAEKNERRPPVMCDPAEGVHKRAEILSLLFRETDRAQRMGTCLTMVLCGIEGGPRGVGSSREMRELLVRLNRLLRSYDLLGELGPGALLIALPGCQEQNAVRLAERARAEVFARGGIGNSDSVWTHACFGIVESCGRSPLTVLREAEQALAWARAAGPGSIRLFCAGNPARTIPQQERQAQTRSA